MTPENLMDWISLSKELDEFKNVICNKIYLVVILMFIFIIKRLTDKKKGINKGFTYVV